MTALDDSLRTLARHRTFFAHQSVGRNILAGVAELAAEARVPLPIIELRGDEPPCDRPGLYHVNIGENGNPAGKVAAFAERLAAAPGFDAAMLKLCYVDLDAADARAAAALLDCYANAMTALRKAQPHLRVVHASVPLRAELASWRTQLKRILGRDQYGDAENATRNAYNEALRHRFAADPIFDLATVESTLPDGRRSRFMRQGAEVFTLAQRYTDDGAHLNGAGRRVAAAAFIQSLAVALGPS